MHKKRQDRPINRDENGRLVFFTLPFEAIAYDQHKGRQSIKDKIDDTMYELAGGPDPDQDERIIWDDADRISYNRKSAAGLSII